jgi:hypothetical protein
VLDATLTVAAAITVLGIVATPFAIVGTLTSYESFVTDVPVVAPWPQALPCSQPEPTDTGGLQCASLPVANLTIRGLSTAPRVFLALGQLGGIILFLAPAAVIGFICFQTLRGRPFSRVAGRALLVAAGVVLVVGIGTDLALGLARGLVASEALPSTGPGVTAPGVYSLTVQMWPIGAALALAAIAAVFRYGSRLQRETDLLV